MIPAGTGLANQLAQTFKRTWGGPVKQVMNCWPIVVRELRAESRRRVNYALRTVAAALTIILFQLPILAAGGSTRVAGNALFAEINWVVFIGIWLVVPFLTGDSLSKEKREGTMGLLLLTPLKATDVVIGKCLVHLVRAVSAFLAVFPVMAIILLVGGVTGRDIFFALIAQGGAIILALAAGLLASSLVRGWNASLLLTALLASVFGHVYHQWSRSIPFGQWPIGMTLGISMVVFGLILWLAAIQVRRTAKDQPRSKRQIWLVRIFCSPLFWRSFFRQSMRRKLDDNPIGWLHHYSTLSRVTKWIWALMAVWVVSLAIGSFGGGLLLQFELLLAVVLSFSAASSFYRERQNRVMELILVSPLSEREIIMGRMRGLCSQFLPAILFIEIPLFCFYMISAAHGIGNRDSFTLFGHLFVFAMTMVSLATAGVYFALRTKTLVMAWSLTGLFGLLIPAAIAGPGMMRYGLYYLGGRSGLVLLYQFLLFLWCASELTNTSGKNSIGLFRERPKSGASEGSVGKRTGWVSETRVASR